MSSLFFDCGEGIFEVPSEYVSIIQGLVSTQRKKGGKEAVSVESVRRFLKSEFIERQETILFGIIEDLTNLVSR